jgi:hypothetical protein
MPGERRLQPRHLPYHFYEDAPISFAEGGKKICARFFANGRTAQL